MADIEHIVSHWDVTVEPSILEQYRSSPNWKGVLKSVIEKLQVVENDSWEIANVLDFSTPPTGNKLDYIAGLKNLKRDPGEGDSIFYQRFLEKVSQNKAGTPDFVISVVKRLSGDNNPEYLEEVPAVFFVYTPHGRQLSRAQVRQMAPAGVLGLPGAAIKFLDGTFMGDVDDGKKFLAVADDADIGATILTLGDNILTLNGAILTLD